MVAVAGGGADTYLSVPLNGGVNDTVVYSAWVRPPVAIDDGTVTLSLQMVTSGGAFNPITLTSQTFTSADAFKWAQLTWKGELKGALMITVSGAGVFWVDNVEVYQV